MEVMMMGLGWFFPPVHLGLELVQGMDGNGVNARSKFSVR